jgi:voltage-gated potassium channel
MSFITTFKHELSRVFDDNLRTKQWHNFVDYAIIGLIIISTLEVFASTYAGVVERYGNILHIVDYTTTIIFTIEVLLRIWCADLLDEKYKGFWGRVRYCFSFYGFIDIISTFPFYLNFFFNIPYVMLKALRIARLLRVFRYIRAFNILSRAISSKKEEMWVSVQFLVIITLILSFILFFVEHDVQPQVYDNGWRSVVWAFAQYIGDPGNFADTPPITLVGRLIACVIGVLGIAIFAVPAGLIGSGFSDIMAEDAAAAKLKSDIDRIVHSFKFVKDQHHTQLFVVPRYKDLNTIVTRQFLTTEDIIKAVEASDCLHLYNMANAVNSEDNPQDKIVVFNYKRNTPYGCCIDRGSKITIIFTSGNTESCTSWFAYHIAKLGGFNFISKEVDTDPNNPTSYYAIPNEPRCTNLPLFLEDLNRLTARPGSWAIPILGATGPRSRPHQFHFCYNTKKKDASYDDPQSKIKDYAAFDKLYNHLSDTLKRDFDYNCDKNEYYAIGKQNIAHYITADNIFTLRVECFVWLSDFRRMATIKALADGINAVLEPEVVKQLPPEMVSRVEGHDFGMQDYVD